MSGLWYAIIPEAGTNLWTNPSVEFNTTGFAGTGATISRSTTYARFGTACVRTVTPNAATGEGVITPSTVAAGGIAVTVAESYTFSVYVFGAGTVIAEISWRDAAGALLSNSSTSTITLTTSWVRYSVTATAPASSAVAMLRVKTASQQASTFYCDGWQLQKLSYLTTYIDGTQSGCIWNGPAHGSTSTRDAQYRNGGKLIDIESTYNVKAHSWDGMGMPPITNDYQPTALQPGAQFNFSKFQSRVLTLTLDTLTGVGSSLSALHLIRKNLVNLFNPDKYRDSQPVTLAYAGANTSKYVYGDFRLDGGLDVQSVIGALTERIPVRLIQDVPFLTTDNQENAALGLTGSLASNNRVAARINGTWQNLGTGFSGTVRCIAVDKDLNRTYFGGVFATGNGVTLNGIGYWDNEAATFVAMDAGVAVGGTVHSIVIDSSHNVWIGGDFLTIGSGATACVGLARWNYSASTWTAFSPSTIAFTSFYALSIAPDTSDIYCAGNFSSALSNYMIMYDVSAAGFVAVGTGANGVIYALLAIKSTEVYIGGSFTTFNGTSATRICKWTGSATSTMSSGANSTVYTIARHPDKTIYVGGAFSTTPTTSYIAKWTGTSWQALGTGLNGTCHQMGFRKDGLLLAAGEFTTAGGITLPDRMSYWTGSSWVAMDIDLPGTAIIYSCAFNGFDIYLGYDTTGTASIANAVSANTVVPTSTAITYPFMTFTGSTTANAQYTLKWIENYTLGVRIYLDMVINSNEVVTFDFRPGSKRITSTSEAIALSGGSTDRTPELDSPSEFEKFALLPGDNVINVFATGTVTGATALIHWTPTFISADGVAA